MALCSLPVFGLLLSILEQSIGTRVRAAVVEMIMMMVTMNPSCLNMIPAIPDTMVRGRNTQSIVRVEAITDMATSDVPWTAASFGFSPLSRWVDMFSSTTIASSTTMPIAMESADMDMMFRVLPVAKRYTSEPRSAIGMERTMMKVALHLPRNRKTTSITTRRVMIMVSFRELMVLMIFVEPSTTVVILMSEGRVS